MLTLTNRIDMRPGAVPLVVHLGQYDSDFTLVFELYSSAGNFTVESGTTAMIRGTKTDGHAYDADATINISAKTVTVAGNEQMTAAKGRNVYELVLKKGTKVLSTANFILDVERAAMDADTIASESVLKELNAIIDSAATSTQAAANAASAADQAEDAAESVSSASAQIATNTADISDLKADLSDIATEIDIVSPNINDEDYELGGIYNGNPYVSSTVCRTKNYIPVTSGATIKGYGYYGSVSNTISAVYINEYNSEKTFIAQTPLYLSPRWSGLSLTLQANTKYIKFATADEISGLDISNVKISLYYESDYKNAYTEYFTPYDAHEIKAEHGLVVSNGVYTHFYKVSDNLYICREFRRAYINNLLQLYKMYYGSFIKGAFVEKAPIGISYSDVVGPVSIYRGDIDGWNGSWSGGTHGYTINGVEYPTAEQDSLTIKVNGDTVSSNGIYYGDVTIIATNNLYYPRTITGDDLSEATLALIETRIYTLKDKMNVKVILACDETEGWINVYFGCQVLTYNMAEIMLPNNEIAKPLLGTGHETYYLHKAENKVLCKNNLGEHYDITLHNYGLGNYAHNDGSNTAYYYGNVATFQKFYYQLIANNTAIQSGKKYVWEADYDFYID